MISCLAWPSFPATYLPKAGGVGDESFQPLVVSAISPFYVRKHASFLTVSPGSPWHPGCLWCCAGAEAHRLDPKPTLFVTSFERWALAEEENPLPPPVVKVGMTQKFFSFPKLYNYINCSSFFFFFPLAPVIYLRCTEY